MLVFFKFCIIWFIAGFASAAISVLYNIVVHKIYIKRREIKIISTIIAWGIISVPSITYLIITDVIKYKKLKHRRKFKEGKHA